MISLKNITPASIKQNNYSLIYHIIYDSGKISKQDIAHELRLSLPTVTQNLVKLEEEGLIEKSGQFASQVGRKAAAYSICEQARIGIGIELSKSRIRMLAVDLYGHPFCENTIYIPYENNDSYYKKAGSEIEAFIESLPVPSSHILGVNIAMQALISPDGQTVTYGKILDCTGLHISAFSRYINYPCRFIHDAECAAVAEIWSAPDIQDALYLSIGNHLGASLIIDGKIRNGRHGHSATVEHMIVKPDGKPCYCGQRGCMETICSIQSLLAPNEDLDAFFASVHSKEESAVSRWDAYLSDLAYALHNLHFIIDGDFILGGHLAAYLTENDISRLNRMVRENFPLPGYNDCIHASTMPKNNVPVGAALPQIIDYLKNRLGE